MDHSYRIYIYLMVVIVVNSSIGIHGILYIIFINQVLDPVVNIIVPSLKLKSSSCVHQNVDIIILAVVFFNSR